MAWQHPVLQEMVQSGCSDRMKVMVAFQAFMKLCEEDKLWDVQFFYNKELDLIYLTSADKKDQVVHVPVPIQQPLSPAWIHNTSTTLNKTHPNAKLNILLKTPDTSFLPYRVTEGLCLPPTPESTKEKKAIQEKLQYIQSELHKRKAEFYEEAKRKRSKKVDEIVIRENTEEPIVGLKPEDVADSEKLKDIEVNENSKGTVVSEQPVETNVNENSNSTVVGEKSVSEAEVNEKLKCTGVGEKSVSEAEVSDKSKCTGVGEKSVPEAEVSEKSKCTGVGEKSVPEAEVNEKSKCTIAGEQSVESEVCEKLKDSVVNEQLEDAVVSKTSENTLVQDKQEEEKMEL